ncbi:MAG: hypothetical protein NTY19_12230 [Planctomycetota bacterium]|nr:hypothetical protein [Planctomycetota bacterium]
MASRESQGLQVALILFVMVTVVLAITTYVYFRKSEEKIKEAKSAVTQAQQAKDALNTVQFENQVLKNVVGYERKTDAELATIKLGLQNNKLMDEIQANYEQDMAMYGTGLAKDDLTYRNLPKHLLTTIQERNAQLADANVQVKSFQSAKEQARDEEMKKTALAIKGQEVAQADLQKEREIFNTARATVTAASTDVAKKMSDRDKQFQVASAQMQKEKEELQKSKDLVEQLAQTYKQRLDKVVQDKPSETPAGEIKWVDQRSNMVWINLGTVDGVQRQMTFTVIDQKETVVGRAKPKGRIEVTRVMEDHTAEARIVDNPINDPIMVGDKLFSPSFKKGQRIHFALVGIVDIDGDGRSDQAKVKSIISMNGGVVDAEMMPEDGAIAGKMTTETNYLVQGQKPTDKTNEKLTKGYTTMIDEAQRLGIQMITVDKLLDKMGYSAEKRVTDMSRGGGAGGAGAKQEKQPFRKRTAGSAY